MFELLVHTVMSLVYHITGILYTQDESVNFGDAVSSQLFPFELIGEYYFSLNLNDSDELSNEELYKLFYTSPGYDNFANEALESHPETPELLDHIGVDSTNQLHIHPTDVNAEVYSYEVIQRGAEGQQGDPLSHLTEMLFFAPESCIDNMGYYTKEALHELDY